jgi:hypothetical protein
MTDTTAEEVQALFKRLREEHPGDFITVAEIRNAVLEEAAQVAENLKTLEAWLPVNEDGTGEDRHTTIHGEKIASAIRSLKSGDSK